MDLASVRAKLAQVSHQVRGFVFSRTSQEWKEYFGALLQRARRYAQDNGEKSAGLGFLFGIILIFFFKLVVVTSIIVAVAALTVIIWADSRPSDWKD